MRKSKKETLESRLRIVAAASREFRKNGIVATGLSDLMKAADMTHGGFYKHFDSKDQLVAEAVGAALDGVLDELAEQPTLKQAVGGYLTMFQRKGVAEGCPLAAMGSELGRAGEPTREIMTSGFERFVQIIADKLPATWSGEEKRRQAVFSVAAMVGALTLSQVVAEEKLSVEILGSVLQSLTGDGAD